MDVGDLAHRFNSVHHQIEHHLLQLDPIRKNERHVIRELRL